MSSLEVVVGVSMWDTLVQQGWCSRRAAIALLCSLHKGVIFPEFAECYRLLQLPAAGSGTRVLTFGCKLSQFSRFHCVFTFGRSVYIFERRHFERLHLVANCHTLLYMHTSPCMCGTLCDLPPTHTLPHTPTLHPNPMPLLNTPIPTPIPNPNPNLHTSSPQPYPTPLPQAPTPTSYPNPYLNCHRNSWTQS